MFFLSLLSFSHHFASYPPSFFFITFHSFSSHLRLFPLVPPLSLSLPFFPRGISFSLFIVLRQVFSPQNSSGPFFSPPRPLRPVVFTLYSPFLSSFFVYLPPLCFPSRRLPSLPHSRLLNQVLFVPFFRLLGSSLFTFLRSAFHPTLFQRPFPSPVVSSTPSPSRPFFPPCRD